jgi:hypothetical protein
MANALKGTHAPTAMRQYQHPEAHQCSRAEMNAVYGVQIQAASSETIANSSTWAKGETRRALILAGTSQGAIAGTETIAYSTTSREPTARARRRAGVETVQLTGEGAPQSNLKPSARSATKSSRSYGTSSGSYGISSKSIANNRGITDPAADGWETGGAGRQEAGLRPRRPAQEHEAPWAGQPSLWPKTRQVRTARSRH